MPEDRAALSRQSDTGHYAVGQVECPKCGAPAGFPCNSATPGVFLAEDHHERLVAERDELRMIVGVYVSLHGSDRVPKQLRSLASSCAFRAVAPDA